MLRAAFALIVVLTLESTAHARCRMQSPEQRYREAAAVFLGVASDPRQVEGSLWEWTIEPYASWKGPRRPTRVRAHRTWPRRRGRRAQRAEGAQPPMPFSTDQLLLFYATWENGQLQVTTGRCSRAVASGIVPIAELGRPRWRRVSTGYLRRVVRRRARSCGGFDIVPSDPRVLRVEGCSDNLLPQGAYWLYRVTKREQRVTFTNGQLLQ